MTSFFELLLSEEHVQQLLPPDITDTLYAAIIPDDYSRSLVYDWVKECNLNAIVPSEYLKIYPIEEYHTTLVYSRKNGNRIYEKLQDFRDMELAHGIMAAIDSFDIFGDYIVLKLKSKILQELFDDLIKVGATFDFPNYCPHISIGSFVSGTTEKYKLAVLSALNFSNKLKDSPITYSHFVSEALS